MKSFEIEFENIKQICSSLDFKQEIERTKMLLSNKPLVLYGAGAVGISTAKIFKYYEINVNCFCDKNKTGMEEETGLTVNPPQILLNKYSEANIIICSVNFKDEIINDLYVLGINPERIVSDKFLNLHQITFDDLKPHINGYQRAFDSLYDNQSKKIMLERIQCYLTPIPISSKWITSMPPNEQYFDSEIIALSDCEHFVDGGMYTGDTASYFFKRVDGNFKHYYGFEPDIKNFSTAQKNLFGKSGVTIIPKGLWSHEARLAFNGNLTSSSQLNEADGNSYVDVTALDTFFNDKIPPTFIKMDIEGAELEALKGAEQIIREHKPKLAICAYHKPEDLYTLLEQIKYCRDDYKFYLRHYTGSIYETVLYAV